MSHDQPDEPTAPLPSQQPGPPPGRSQWGQGQAPSGPPQGYPPPPSQGGPTRAPQGARPYSPYPPPPPQAGQQGRPAFGWGSGPGPGPGPEDTRAYGVVPPVGDGPEKPARRSSRWMWPLVALLALVLGGVGGAVTAGLMGAGDGGATSTVQVQERTAAPLPADNGSIAAVAAKVLPSTVQIVAEYDGKDQGATGSGFVLDAQGHVITNNHVVAQADEDKGPIVVIDQDGRRYPATVVGRSTVYDLAVLKAKGAERLTPAAIGSSDQMRVGETVVAIGSPLGLSATVTSGIISAVNRPVTTGEGQDDNSYINAVQTDAAINPGNSGGPLVNLQGQVVGVNSAIASLGSQVAGDQGGNIGVGFAIPIEQVRVTTTQILRTGKAQYPVIGANVRGTTKLDGATVESVSPGSPAAKAKLKDGDVIREVDGTRVTSSIDLVVAIRSHTPGQKVTFTVSRGGRTFDVQVGLVAKTG